MGGKKIKSFYKEVKKDNKCVRGAWFSTDHPHSFRCLAPELINRKKNNSVNKSLKE